MGDCFDLENHRKFESQILFFGGGIIRFYSFNSSAPKIVSVIEFVLNVVFVLIITVKVID